MKIQILKPSFFMLWASSYWNQNIEIWLNIFTIFFSDFLAIETPQKITSFSKFSFLILFYGKKNYQEKKKKKTSTMQLVLERR
jgi:hypothetical protein